METAASLASGPIHTARARIRELDASTLAEQRRLVAIPAPTFEEDARARYVADRFREIGLERVYRDEVGNVLGRLPHDGASDARAALITAHLDTVFSAEVDVRPRIVGERIYAPGITDNCRGLAALLAVAAVLVEMRIQTTHTVWFVATVGEEGAGDLYGVKHLFRSGGELADASSFVSLDGSGLRRIVHRALGSRRLRVELRGPGGHSWSDFGRVNPLHAAATAMARLAALELPADPPTSLTIARSGGGTTINAIPSEAWFEVDMRSEGGAELETLARAAQAAIAHAAIEENQERRPGTEELTVRVRVIGDRPSGGIPEDDPLVKATIEATRLVGAEPKLVASSTDANVAIARGIPAVTIGAGGESGGIHTLEEWYENDGGAEGLERSLLVTIAAAGGLAPEAQPDA